jgi:hypothetical protein
MPIRRWVVLAIAILYMVWDSMDGNNIAATLEFLVVLLLIGMPNDPPNREA